MKKVFFLLNSLSEFTFGEHLKKYLHDVNVTIGESLPSLESDYDLIVLWSLRKILKDIAQYRNIVVFHSSDLPQGKGWAPVYYSLKNQLEYHTISCIIAAGKVDSGNIVAKARYRIRDDFTAPLLREWDREIAILLTRAILDRFCDGSVRGQPQVGEGSYFPRRTPAESQVELDATLANLLPHLRGCEESHPAYFLFNNVKYLITVKPETAPSFPDDLDIVFPAITDLQRATNHEC